MLNTKARCDVDIGAGVNTRWLEERLEMESTQTVRDDRQGDIDGDSTDEDDDAFAAAHGCPWTHSRRECI